MKSYIRFVLIISVFTVLICALLYLNVYSAQAEVFSALRATRLEHIQNVRAVVLETNRSLQVLKAEQLQQSGLGALDGVCGLPPSGTAATEAIRAKGRTQVRL